jgi:lysophospholipase L1-like esterase
MIKNIFLKVVSIVIITFLLSGCSSINTINEDTTGIIDADNPYIHYFGRFDFSNPKKVTFDWAGVHISAKFEGTSCAVRLNDSANEYSFVIDNSAPRLLVKDSLNNFIAVKGLNSAIPHTITIQKRTESFIGKGEFEGFILDKGKKLLMPDKKPERRIEFIGNSITCGFGVEVDSSDCHFSPQTENANLSYASITARTLNADYSLVAYSGRGVVRNYGDSNKTSVDPMPTLYDRICFNDSTSKWDFSKWIPQVVVINLGTNDFSTQPFPDKDVFQNAYKKLIDRVRILYPGVDVFCLCGPMIDEPCKSYIKEVIKHDQENKRDKDVFFVEISRTIMADAEWGCDMHPNVRGMIRIADIVSSEIKARMNW